MADDVAQIAAALSPTTAICAKCIALRSGIALDRVVELLRGSLNATRHIARCPRCQQVAVVFSPHRGT